MHFEGDAVVGGPRHVFDFEKKNDGMLWKFGNLTAKSFWFETWDTGVTQHFWGVGYQHILDSLTS